MNASWKSITWSQFGAAIDMLRNGMKACPEDLWQDRSHRPEIWYMVYHTLFYLDCYLTDSLDKFTPPAPFNLDELEPAGLLPDRVYSKAELQTYLEYGHRKCRITIEAFTEEKAESRCGFDWLDLNRAELLLYNMRHVQHHAAQLNLLLRQNIDSAPRWVRKTNSKLSGE